MRHFENLEFRRYFPPRATQEYLGRIIQTRLFTLMQELYFA